jgi:hypothetical protein
MEYERSALNVEARDVAGSETPGIDFQDKES